MVISQPTSGDRHTRRRRSTTSREERRVRTGLSTAVAAVVSGGLLPGRASSRRVSLGPYVAGTVNLQDSRYFDQLSGSFSTITAGSAGTTVATVDHSGLEGYGRYLGGHVEAGDHSDSMDYSDGSISSSSNSNRPIGLEPLCGIDRGLASYGRYLGSSSEPADYGTSSQTSAEGFRDCDYGHRRNHEFSSGSLSDYSGLGSYCQPFHETDDLRYSNGLSNDDSAGFSTSFSYGGRLS